MLCKTDQHNLKDNLFNGYLQTVIEIQVSDVEVEHLAWYFLIFLSKGSMQKFSTRVQWIGDLEQPN